MRCSAKNLPVRRYSRYRMAAKTGRSRKIAFGIHFTKPSRNRAIRSSGDISPTFVALSSSRRSSVLDVVSAVSRWIVPPVITRGAVESTAELSVPVNVTLARKFPAKGSDRRRK